jgi:hypothetical protein
MRQEKRGKLSSGKYFPAELPEAAGKEVAGNNAKLAGKRQAPAGPQALAIETNAPAKLAGEQQDLAGSQALAVETTAPAAEDLPLVLAVEPQAPAWAQHIVHFLQTGELPEEQEEAEKVARQSKMYQFVDNVLY